ncbi:MAG: glycosyltransferase family 4 protein [Desulfobacterota bacterium]|nr:glycosyltransferase family 4 protein [Thermodesulfobacteriota bacterium]
MKILILNDDFPPFAYGGAGVIACRLAREYQRQGHEVFVVAATQRKDRTGRREVGGISVAFLFSFYPERFRAYFSLYNPLIVPQMSRLLRETAPDVVHAHNIHAHLSYHSLKIAHNRGIPVVLTAHDVMSFAYNKLHHFIDPADLSIGERFDYRVSEWFLLKENRFRYFPLRNLIIRHYLKNNVCRIVSVSNALRDALQANGITNVETIHNGIDLDEMKVDDLAVKQFCEKYGLAGKKVVFFGGRLSYLKGAEQLLDAMKLVIDRVPEAVLLIAGAGEQYRQNLEQGETTKKIANHVVSTKWLDGHELKSAYAISSVVVVPSICFDSFPTAILEAMAAGKPVVATCFGGSRELVVEGETGFIVNPFNSSSMADRIAFLLNDDAVRQTMGETACRRVKESFSIINCAQRYLQLMEGVRCFH